MGDEADGLGGVVLGVGRLVGGREGLAQGCAAAYPGVQAVQGYVRTAGVGEVEHGQLALGVAVRSEMVGWALVRHACGLFLVFFLGSFFINLKVCDVLTCCFSDVSPRFFVVV